MEATQEDVESLRAIDDGTSTSTNAQVKILRSAQIVIYVETDFVSSHILHLRKTQVMVVPDGYVSCCSSFSVKFVICHCERSGRVFEILDNNKL